MRTTHVQSHVFANQTHKLSLQPSHLSLRLRGGGVWRVCWCEGRLCPRCLGSVEAVGKLLFECHFGTTKSSSSVISQV